ncbi:penicillin amidase [Thermoflexales bacterium]|nr:penicillin amidase [Thermoflexales bacterium]
MRRFIRRLIIGIVAIGLFVILIAGGSFIYLTRSAFPQIDGTVQATGLLLPGTVIRDKNGVPHIYAANTHDLFFMQGYVHAQDRLWQMEVSRRGMAGQTSEISPSKSSLEQDRLIRVLGWRRSANADYEALNETDRAALQAYSDGVNRYISTHQNNLPLEFIVVGAFGSQGLNYQPAPWTPIDTLQWAKALAWNLSGNWNTELYRAQVLAKFGEEGGQAILTDLFPAYDSQTKPIVIPSSISWSDVPADLVSLKLLDSLAGTRSHDVGSNGWVVAGHRTTTGQPLLANDPHLGIQIPSIWYFNSLHCQPITTNCPFDVTGATFPGVPGVMVGHNAYIAWGMTNVGADVQDLFLEKIQGTQYEFQGRMTDLTIVPETWTIKGKLPADYQPAKNEISSYDQIADTTTITLNVRYTQHGPIISDVYARASQLPYAVALAWTAIDAPEKTLAAFLRIDTSTNWDEFRAALSIYGTPSQNFIYADTSGNIGYQMPGRIPIRAQGDGRLPVPGWTGKYEWSGYIPFEELPSTLNPAQGYIATANNAVIDADYKYFISMDWDRGYRVQRIVDLITAKAQLSSDDMALIQGDSLNLAAKDVIPYLKKIVVEGDAQKVLTAILNWNLDERQDSVGASAFETFWMFMLHNTFDSVLGDLAREYAGGGDVNYAAMIQLLAKPDSQWWQKMSRDDVIRQSLNDAAKALTAEFGTEVTNWKWSNLHTATFGSQALGNTPVGFIFNRGPYAVDGGPAIVDATGYGLWASYNKPMPNLKIVFRALSVPSLRQIVDLSNLSASCYINTTGESGLPTNPHYDDLIERWRQIQYVPMWWTAEEVKTNAEGTLTIVP